MDPRDTIILSLADKLHICSRLLTAAAERLEWDSEVVQELMSRLDESVEGSQHASIEKAGWEVVYADRPD